MPSENISGRFFKSGETLWGYKYPFIFDELERVNPISHSDFKSSQGNQAQVNHKKNIADKECLYRKVPYKHK